MWHVWNLSIGVVPVSYFGIWLSKNAAYDSTNGPRSSFLLILQHKKCVEEQCPSPWCYFLNSAFSISIWWRAPVPQKSFIVLKFLLESKRVENTIFTIIRLVRNINRALLRSQSPYWWIKSKTHTLHTNVICKARKLERNCRWNAQK